MYLSEPNHHNTATITNRSMDRILELRTRLSEFFKREKSIFWPTIKVGFVEIGLGFDFWQILEHFG